MRKRSKGYRCFLNLLLIPIVFVVVYVIPYISPPLGTQIYLYAQMFWVMVKGSYWIVATTDLIKFVAPVTFTIIVAMILIPIDIIIMIWAKRRRK